MALREMEHTCSLANCVFTCEQVWCAVLGQQSLFGGVNFVWEGVCKELHPLFASLKPLVDCGGVGVAQHEHGGLVVWMCAGKWCHKLAFLVNGATYCAQVREKSSCNGDGITSLR